MRQLIAYFIKYPVAGNVIMFLIIIFGYFGFKNVKSTFFPESKSRIIQIQVTYPGSSPEEIEEGIVLKIEDNLKSITGIEQVSSVSSENSGQITVEIEKGYDTDLILQDVKNAVDRISSFPTGMEPPVVFKQENLNFAISFSLNGDVGLQTLKLAARKVENDLRAVKGISKVSLSGFPDEIIEIGFREHDLQAYQLTFDQVSQAVQNANIEITGGTIKADREELLIRARSKGYYADDLKNIIVRATANGNVVRLKDVADVKDDWSDNPNRNYLNGKPSVVVTVQNTIEEDILYITDYIKKYIDTYNASATDIKATVIRDGSITLTQRIELLVKNGLIGFALVLLFLALFLNIRLAFWVALGIPISFMGMFILAAFYGLTINVISLFGMILVIGILVDDGIVIGENIFQHFEKGKSPLRAAIDGTMEVFPAVTSAVLTTVVAFGTFFFLDGRLGDFGPNMAFVVMATLAFSLVEGALILPAHISHNALVKDRKMGSLERNTTKLMAFMRNRLYAPVLRFSLNNKWMAMSIFIGLFIITLGAMRGGIIKATFFPFIERDNISVTLEMPPGTRDHITESWLTHIEQAAWEVNEELKAKREDTLDVVLRIEKKVGPGINQGSLDIVLLDGETRNMQSFTVANAIRDKAGPIYGADKISFGGASPFGKPVAISLLGNNLEELEGASQELKQEMVSLSSVKDVIDNNQKGIKELNIKLKEKAHLLGLNLRQVLAQVRQGFFGGEVQRLQRGIDEVKIWVRYDMQDRSSLGKLERMRIRTANGQEIPLQEIAEYEIERGVIAINHLNGKREIRTEADLANPTESATEIMANIRDSILPDILAKYPSVGVSFEGQNKQSQKTADSGGKVLPIILILMIAIVTLTFRSFPQALVVFIIVPLGLIGIGWGHFAHGAPISLLSGFGIIALIGVMVNDSLVLVTAMNNLLREGKSVAEAIYEAGLSRFRPIILTSVTTIAGLGPLILEKSFQAQFLIPMAIAIAYGLAIATFTTLIVLPVLLLVLNRIRVYLTWLWEGKKPSSESVEPAVKELKHHHETA